MYTVPITGCYTIKHVEMCEVHAGLIICTDKITTREKNNIFKIRYNKKE